MSDDDMLLALWLTLTAAPPADAVDGGTTERRNTLAAPMLGFSAPTTQALRDADTLPTQRLVLKGSLTQWLAANARELDDSEPAMITAGGFTGFEHGDQAGVFDEATRTLTKWPTERINDPLVLITLPGPRSGRLLCTEIDCSEDGYRCAKALLAEYTRRCTWVAPACPGVPAVDLSARFNRISVERDVITAEVFDYAKPTCAPGDGPTPRWAIEQAKLGSWGPSWLLRGTLEAHACTPPTWKRTLGHFVLAEDGDDPVDPVYGRLRPVPMPRCR